MNTIEARNMHDLTTALLPLFGTHGIKESSRNGDVLRLPGTVCCTLYHPMENVCLFPARDANPFFHLIEAMAMLVGYNSNPLLSFFASNMSNFSDDGQTYNAFYGTRARVTFGDQLLACINLLHQDPDTRRAVVSLVDPADLTKQTKDVACNLNMVFSVRDEKVCMTTFNRSNDAIWGFATGANMVHFPFFQLFVANSLGREVGEWTHVSNNMHVYLWNEKYQALCNDVAERVEEGAENPYVVMSFDKNNLFEREGLRGVFEEQMLYVLKGMEISVRLQDPVCLERHGYYLQFIRNTVIPMFNTFVEYKRGRSEKKQTKDIYESCREHFTLMPERSDWRFGAEMWLAKRLKM